MMAYARSVITPCGDPTHGTEISESQNSEKGSAGVPKSHTSLSTEQQQQCSRRLLTGKPRQRAAALPERRSYAEVPLRRRDVRGARLDPVAADPLYQHVRARWRAALRAGGK